MSQLRIYTDFFQVIKGLSLVGEVRSVQPRQLRPEYKSKTHYNKGSARKYRK
jgi:hypothetical protein